MIIFLLLGIITSIFQLVSLREFNFSVAKNELAFIVAAGFWIIFCSLGSLIKQKKARALPIPVLISAVFFLSISLIHLIKPISGIKYYETTHLGLVLFFGVILIGPAALVLGIAFREFVEEYLQNNPVQNKTYAKFFAFEAIGFFCGGILFTFCLSNYPNPLIFSLLPLILLPQVKFNQRIISAGLIIAISLASLISFDFILKKEFDNADILFNLGSGYGPVTGARKSGSTLLFSGGWLLASSEDKSMNEEFIHMSLSAANPAAKKDILFIGPCVSGQAEEIIKYNPASLDCLQINPLISKIGRERLTGKNAKINFITDDPRAHLKNITKKYDAILMNLPAPANLELNRYFTVEFFKYIAARLKDRGIFSFTIPSKREILSPQFAKFDSSIANAVNNVFAYRFIIPSDSMIIISSNDQEITDKYLLDNFERTKPETSFFTLYHFQDYLTPSMRDYVQSMLDKKITANSDFNPSGFLNYIFLEQAKFWPDFKVDSKKTRQAVIIFLLLGGAVMIVASYLSKKFFSLLNIALTGFNSISLTSIIFVLFQLYCGALFWKLGILTALFMAGLSISTFCANKINVERLLAKIYLLWMLANFILFFNLKAIGGLNQTNLVLFLYAFICGTLTGASYPCLVDNLVKNKFNNQRITATIYSMDLVGAFLGTVVCGIFLIPFLGVPYSLLTLIILNAVAVLRNLST